MFGHNIDNPQVSSLPVVDAVLVPRTVLGAMSDHLQRAEMAARQAARVATTAALAFEQEANCIQADKMQVDALLYRFR